MPLQLQQYSFLATLTLSMQNLVNVFVSKICSWKPQSKPELVPCCQIKLVKVTKSLWLTGEEVEGMKGPAWCVVPFPVPHACT